MNQRIEFIDVARGMAMLLVIFGHCFVTEEALLNKYILSFSHGLVLPCFGNVYKASKM